MRPKCKRCRQPGPLLDGNSPLHIEVGWRQGDDGIWRRGRRRGNPLRRYMQEWDAQGHVPSDNPGRLLARIFGEAVTTPMHWECSCSAVNLIVSITT